MTATALIQQALREICELRPGQATSTDVNNECLVRLNQMIEAWYLDRLMVYAISADIYALVTGTQQYTIGAGGTFNAARPTRIEYANVIINTVTPSIRQPLDLITVQEWASVRIRVLANAIPLVLYNDMAFPLSTLNLWPGPMAAYGLELFTWKQLSQFADLTTDYTFPPGYSRALRLNLAVEIAPSMKLYFKVSQPMFELIVPQAAASLMEIKSFNAPDPLLTCDPAFTQGNRGGVWNWMIGDYNRGNN